MPEIIHCPDCDRTVSVPERLLGKTVRCPSCKATFVAEAEEAEVEVVEEKKPPRPPARRAAGEETADERPTKREPPRNKEAEKERPKRKPLDEDEEEAPEEDRPRRKRRKLKGDEVWGWKRVRLGLTVMLVAAVIGLLANIGGVIGFKAIVEKGTGAAGADVTAIGPSPSTAFTMLLVFYFLGCAIAVGVAIASNIICMAIPGQPSARSTLTSCIAMMVLGMFLFVGGVIELIIRLRVWENALNAGREQGPGAPPLEGLLIFIFGGALLLLQPAVFSLFARTAAKGSRQEGLALILIFQALVAAVIAVVFVVAAMNFYSSLKGVFGAVFENRVPGGAEETGQTASSVLKVLYFAEFAFAAFFITTAILIRVGISRYVERREA